MFHYNDVSERVYVILDCHWQKVTQRRIMDYDICSVKAAVGKTSWCLMVDGFEYGFDVYFLLKCRLFDTKYKFKCNLWNTH